MSLWVIEQNIERIQKDWIQRHIWVPLSNKPLLGPQANSKELSGNDNQSTIHPHLANSSKNCTASNKYGIGYLRKPEINSPTFSKSPSWATRLSKFTDNIWLIKDNFHLGVSVNKKTTPSFEIVAKFISIKACSSANTYYQISNTLHEINKIGSG